ncbi:cbb3-type cytochrome c oxidase subunit I [Aromatoleum petrolei]|uniref:Cytochrome C oxidase subunit I n=1 Tax=Aromatoleum petrolei TaxID=76116 RepID=A0ABX1MSU4_9RHOO|nr:cbb3-type cytochrome c oxidase subunit I [Aromatoleum petrolei]NMF91037.1 cytochrome C oxidase subunit I [Aromatoleum petrolei]QTQ35928.1 Cytochrome c oxidase, subunit I [Aromatoleum petrolei]
MATYTYEHRPDHGAKAGVLAYLATSAAVLLLMMLFGLLMRLEQAQWISIGADRFYQLMTLHGAGMVGIAAIAGASVMWHFLRQYVDLSSRIFIANLVLFLAGVVMILASVLLGRFHGAWTFLFPLPAKSMGMWSADAAALFMGGLLVIGVGFLLLHLDVARAIVASYGNFARALGWPQLFGHDDGKAPPPTVVASAMVTIVNVIGLVVGASILTMMLVNLYVPGFTIDALLAKGMIYFFGHVFINATIYMAVIAVYEILPRYTQRPWKSNKVFLASWTASTLMVLFIFPHHLLMDFAFPKWMLIMGHIIGYLNTVPILVVTGYGALMIVYRSGIRWDMASKLLFLSLFGWAAGAMPAFIDGTITVNYVMHNTLWVPGHFHTYLLLGMVTMVFGFMYYLGKPDHEADDRLIDRIAFWLFTSSVLGFTLSFLYSGKESVARRYAAHLPEWVPYDRIASVFAVLVIASSLLFVGRFFARIRLARHDYQRAPVARPATA